MSTIKQNIFALLYKTKALDLLRFIRRKNIIILLYHRFSAEKEPFKIQKEIFERQIKFLKKKYNFISLKYYTEYLCNKRKDCPENSIIVTIDDGYWDNYAFAYPILKKYSIPATIFLTTDFINNKSWLWSNKLEYILKNSKFKKFEFVLNGKACKFQIDSLKDWHRTQLKIYNYCRNISNHDKNKFLKELASYLRVNVPEQSVGDFKPLTWEKIKEMQQNGIEFGSHTCSHPILSNVTDEELKHEIIDSKKEIESKLQNSVYSFSYPNGQIKDFNNLAIKMLQKADYYCAVTSIYGFNEYSNIDKFILKRVAIASDNKMTLSKELTNFRQSIWLKKRNKLHKI